MGGRQVVIAVAKVVFSKLAGDIALSLEQLGDRYVAGLQTFLGTRQAHLQQAGAEAALAGDKTRASGRAALLAIPVGEEGSGLGDGINVWRLVAHHALVVGTDVPIADVVTPEDQDIGLFGRCGVGLRDDGSKSRQDDDCGENESAHDGWFFEIKSASD